MTVETKPPRVSFFVDGFNLYHSIRQAERDSQGTPLKWLNLKALCDSYLFKVGGGALTEEIHYFSAYAEHLHKEQPEKLDRHKAFARALTASRVKPHVGTFRKRSVWREESQERGYTYEEKETDVAIACEVLSHATKDLLDVAIIISGDSDFVPLVKTFNDLYPEKKILFAFPYGRTSKQLRNLCPESFTISKEAYERHQFQQRVKLPSGKFISCPTEWRKND